VWAAPEVVSVSEAGLLGLAIDPDFATNHRVYIALSYRLPNGGHANRLVRMHEENGKGVMEAVLLDGVMGSTQHDGGRVHIGPDSMIYWTTGDSGNGDLSQDVRSLNGKILRVNLDGSIPSDNPIPGSPIYSYGHRNPQGLAWQPGTQDLYATEHGPGGNPDCCQDEVNRIPPGQNYGWPVIAVRGPGRSVLTEREETVLRLLAQGQSNREIADALVVSLATAERHLTHIYSKLGVRGRPEAIVWALRCGIVD
jgi:glucose/arabinose dehydrogenase